MEDIKKEDPYLYRILNHKPLKFGTSGLRDEDDKLTDMQIYISVKGFLNYLKKIEKNIGGIVKGNYVSLAGDFRPSTPRLFFSVAYAIIDSGFLVDFCNRVPTPTVSLWGFSKKRASIMVTASHNPYGQNGVKFVKPNSEVMKNEENDILDEINKVREIEYNKSWKESLFTRGGFFKEFFYIDDVYQRLLIIKTRKSLNEETINHDPKDFYINRFKNAFKDALAGEKIVFYQQTCVGRDLIPRIFFELGSKVVLDGKVDENVDFVPVDTEDMKIQILEKMAELCVYHNSHVTITTDGDSDRPAVLYVRRDDFGNHIHKNGKPDYYYLDGDKLNVLASLLIKPDYVVCPVSASNKPLEFLKKQGINVRLTKVGSPHVIKKMNEIKESNKNLVVYGFERNGGGLLGSEKVFKGNISSLETRDASFPIICSLVLAREKGINFEELVNEVFSGEFKSHTHSGLIENLTGNSVTLGCEKYDSKVGKEIIKYLSPENLEICEITFDNGIKFFNDCLDEIDINRNEKEKLFKIKNIVLKYIREMMDDSSVDIERINYIDGVRIYLTNSEIVHFRPSGNASQFRIYVEAENEERSIEIVNRAIKPVTGVLVKLINDYIDGKLFLEKEIEVRSE
ncbi:hypothetical protein GOV12_06400 [Candidatus Pacearchaeota archaeon]|nr:hypothetical protein [Candidatus Pacearchaeota archaeon]